MKGEFLGSLQGISVSFTGQQLDQSDLDVWEQAVHLARMHPAGIPGTSCLATMVLSLRDKSHSPIEAPHNYLSAYDSAPRGLCSLVISRKWAPERFWGFSCDPTGQSGAVAFSVSSN